MAVPAEAIYGRNLLYKLSDTRMESVQVERLGERTSPNGNAEVIVRSPKLSKNDKVIVTKLANAADGLLVNVSDTVKETTASIIPQQPQK